MQYTVHGLLPTESQALGQFYRAQAYDVCHKRTDYEGSAVFVVCAAHAPHQPNDERGCMLEAWVGSTCTTPNCAARCQPKATDPVHAAEAPAPADDPCMCPPRPTSVVHHGHAPGGAAATMNTNALPDTGGTGTNTDDTRHSAPNPTQTPSPPPSKWLGCVRLVKIPQQLKGVNGQRARPVWILRELCVALQARRLGLGTLLVCDQAIASLGPTYCFCVVSLVPLYEAAGFDKHQTAEMPPLPSAGEKRAPTCAGVPGWLVEKFVSLSAKQAKKQKPELVMMTRGFAPT